jgi:hypothetical protein
VSEVPPSEEDVLHAQNLPHFGHNLSSEESEQLLSYLSVPYARIPLVCTFFAADRISSLFVPQLRQLLWSVLFEPRHLQAEGSSPVVTCIPAHSRRCLSTPHGMLLNELRFSPAATMQPLLQVFNSAALLAVGSYASAFAEVFMPIAQMAVAVEAYVLHVLDGDLSTDSSASELGTLPFPPL